MLKRAGRSRSNFFAGERYSDSPVASDRSCGCSALHDSAEMYFLPVGPHQSPKAAGGHTLTTQSEGAKHVRSVRRNFAHLTDAERDAYIAAVKQVDLLAYSDGVSYWDKQDQIHQSTHNHGGNSFLPWHRELVNRYEALLRQADPSVALHYWDWTEDPRQPPTAMEEPSICQTGSAR